MKAATLLLPDDQATVDAHLARATFDKETATSWRDAGTETPDHVGVNDVAGVLHSVSGQVADVAEHFESIGRSRESSALTRVAIELNVKALWIVATGKLATTKSTDSIVLSLRSAGLVERDTLLVLRKALAGETLADADMRRLVGLVRSPLVEQGGLT